MNKAINIYLLISTMLLCCSSINLKRRKLFVELESVDICKEHNQICQIKNLMLHRYNRTHKTLNYDITYNRPLDKNIGGIMSLAKWGDGGWINIPFIKVESNICEALRNYFSDVWINLHKNMGVPHPDKCPIPAGNYSLKNFIVDAKEVTVQLWNGRFTMNTTFIDTRNREIVYCMLTNMQVTETFL